VLRTSGAQHRLRDFGVSRLGQHGRGALKSLMSGRIQQAFSWRETRPGKVAGLVSHRSSRIDV